MPEAHEQQTVGSRSANIPVLADEGIIDTGGDRRVEEALRESERRLRMALVNSPVVLFNQDLDLRYMWIHNPHLGFRAEEVLGKTDADLLEPDDAGRLEAIKRRVIETGRSERREVRTSNAGIEAWYDLYAEPLRDGDGRVIGVACAAVDITERKQALDAKELLLRELGHRLRNAHTITQALVLQTARASTSLDAFADAIRGRLMALRWTRTRLTRPSPIPPATADR